MCADKTRLTRLPLPEPPPPSSLLPTPDGLPVAGGSILVHVNNTRIKTMADLKGATIMAGLPNSLVSFQQQAYEMQKWNLSVYTDSGLVSLSREVP